MIKKRCTIVGIEVRQQRDYKTKTEMPPKYYLHCQTTDAQLVEGTATFSGKVKDDEILSRIVIGDTVNIVYTNFNGYNTIEDIYHG